MTQEDLQACILFASKSLAETDFMPMVVEHSKMPKLTCRLMMYIMYTYVVRYNMDRISESKARSQLADMVNNVAFGGKRLVLQRRGKDVAALISIKDLALLEYMEDRLDIQDAEAILADPLETPIPYEEVRRRLGLE